MNGMNHAVAFPPEAGFITDPERMEG